MYFSVFDLLKVGIGPSSSHTIGPMLAAKSFVDLLAQRGQLEQVVKLHVILYGSLAYTGDGHGTFQAIILGLEGYEPTDVPLDRIKNRLRALDSNPSLVLPDGHAIEFHNADIERDTKRQRLYHPNTMEFNAWNSAGELLFSEEYYSVGGGFVQRKSELEKHSASDVRESHQQQSDKEPPYPFRDAKTLFQLCRQHKLTVDQLMWANECSLRDQEEIRTKLDEIYRVMMEAIDRGLNSEGVLSGGLFIKKRAKSLINNLERLKQVVKNGHIRFTSHMTHSYLSAWALAVAEENADFGRIVTSPTCGSCGVMPAVLRFYRDIICQGKVEMDQIYSFILTAGAIGLLFKHMASISGAEVGCQGEIGVAASMSAGALTAVCGGNFAQVESAARASITHFLGLTCDPIKGLVQVPCIERNAIAACQAVDVSQLALIEQDPPGVFTLDQAIVTMKNTGLDIDPRYRETSQAGLATLELNNEEFV